MVDSQWFTNLSQTKQRCSWELLQGKTLSDEYLILCGHFWTTFKFWYNTLCLWRLYDVKTELVYAFIVVNGKSPFDLVGWDHSAYHIIRCLTTPKNCCFVDHWKQGGMTLNPWWLTWILMPKEWDQTHKNILSQEKISLLSNHNRLPLFMLLLELVY